MYKQQFYFDESLLDIKSSFILYFIGLMAADGSVHKNGRYCSIAQSGDDGLSLLKQISFKLKFTGNISTSKTKCQDTHCLSLNSVKLVKLLSDYNVIPHLL